MNDRYLEHRQKERQKYRYMIDNRQTSRQTDTNNARKMARTNGRLLWQADRQTGRLKEWYTDQKIYLQTERKTDC